MDSAKNEVNLFFPCEQINSICTIEIRICKMTELCYNNDTSAL